MSKPTKKPRRPRRDGWAVFDKDGRPVGETFGKSKVRVRRLGLYAFRHGSSIACQLVRPGHANRVLMRDGYTVRPVEVREAKACVWTWVDCAGYKTTCERGPFLHRHKEHGFAFCPYCGARIEEAK